ncbi:MAG: hypothetical protein JSR33_04370 [Proteobacteria bacterium]|nr:hypothetical protein [Pseudomonadota bacterium]
MHEDQPPSQTEVVEPEIVELLVPTVQSNLAIPDPFHPDTMIIVPAPTDLDNQLIRQVEFWLHKYDLLNWSLNKINFTRVFQKAISECCQQNLLRACVSSCLIKNIKPINLFFSYALQKVYKLEILFQWLIQDQSEEYKNLFKQLALIVNPAKNKNLLQHSYERISLPIKKEIARVFEIQIEDIRTYFINQDIATRHTKRKKYITDSDYKSDSKEQDIFNQPAKKQAKDQELTVADTVERKSVTATIASPIEQPLFNNNFLFHYNDLLLKKIEQQLQLLNNPTPTPAPLLMSSSLRDTLFPSPLPRQRNFFDFDRGLDHLNFGSF